MSLQGRDRGFTLVEVVVAIVLVGVLSAVAVVGVGNLTSRGTAAACSASLDAARVAATSQAALGSPVASFDELIASNAISLPSGVTVSGDGGRLQGSGWHLVLQPGVSPRFMCVDAVVAAPLDAMSVLPAAAYSLRRLRSTYTGSAVSVRRSSDNTVANIGFTATGDLDTSTLLAFVGSGSGFVTTWFDQTGNGRHKTQSLVARQPRLVHAGVVESMAGRPAVYHGADAGLAAPAASYLPNATAASVNIVAASGTGLSDARRAVQSAVNNWLIGPYRGTLLYYSGGWNVEATPEWSSTSSEVVTVVQGATNSLFRNGASIPSSNSRVVIGRIGTGVEGTHVEPMLGVISEIVEVNGVLSTADRQLLERNQGAYYGVAVS